MDYEKKYKEAIKRAKSKVKNDKDHILYEDDIIEIFPELAESEDERIRKNLLKMVENTSDISLWWGVDLRKEDAIAWLEKQGEQKSAEWSEEDEEMLNVVMQSCEKCGNEYVVYWLKSLKERYTWKPSDKQIEALKKAHMRCPNVEDGITLRELIEQLKKLKE